jgi:polyisoprenoid-binding protein YceI
MKRFTLSALCCAFAGVAGAAPVTYEIDPSHTFPSFEADHMGGVSVWRGKFNRSTGTVVLDKAAGTGSVDVTIDIASIDFGEDALNTEIAKAEYMDTTGHPKAHYRGKLEGFTDGKPTRVVGELEFRGIKKPVTLDVRSFKCIPHPMHQRELCGADALTTIERDQFGFDAGADWGFDMSVTLRIQVEAVAVASPAAASAPAAAK